MEGCKNRGSKKQPTNQGSISLYTIGGSNGQLILRLTQVLIFLQVVETHVIPVSTNSPLQHANTQKSSSKWQHAVSEGGRGELTPVLNFLFLTPRSGWGRCHITAGTSNLLLEKKKK